MVFDRGACRIRVKSYMCVDSMSEMTPCCCIKSIESCDTLCRSRINSTKNHNSCEILYMIWHSAHNAAHAFCIIRNAYAAYKPPLAPLVSYVLYYTKRIRRIQTAIGALVSYVLYYTKRIRRIQTAIASLFRMLCIIRNAYKPLKKHCRAFGLGAYAESCVKSYMIYGC